MTRPPLPLSLAKKYAGRGAFERLLLLIAVLVRYPGVGCPENAPPGLRRRPAPTSASDSSALGELLPHLQQLADELGIERPRASAASLHKDLVTLRAYGILSPSRYRWGYFLGTGVLSREELQAALGALRSQAQYQADPQIRELYDRITRRLRGHIPLHGSAYPLRVDGNRPIIETDLSAPPRRGQQRKRNLFDCLPTLERAMAEGQAIEIQRVASPFDPEQLGPVRVWPLQLRYYTIAWYLVHEHCSGGWGVSRVDRFADACQVLPGAARGSAAQLASLAQAERLIERGWGLFLGSWEEQSRELAGQAQMIAITVRFWPPALSFILEGEKRHPSQVITLGPRDRSHQPPQYLDYQVSLPKRSIREFSHWVFGFMGRARVIAPPELVAEHRAIAQTHLALFDSLA